MARPGSLGHPELSKAGGCVGVAAPSAVPSCVQLKAVLPGAPELLGLAAPGAESFASSHPPGSGSHGSALRRLHVRATLGSCFLSRAGLGIPLWPQACRASSLLAWVEHGRRTPWGLMGFSSSLGLCFRMAVNGGDPKEQARV